MKSVRADIAYAKRSVRGDLLLHFQRPRFDGRSAQVRLHAAGNDFGARVGRVRCDVRKRDAFRCEDRVERGVLIQAIAQVVEKRVVDAEASTNHRFL